MKISAISLKAGITSVFSKLGINVEKMERYPDKSGRAL